MQLAENSNDRTKECNEVQWDLPSGLKTFQDKDVYILYIVAD